jgi:3-oxosteroid 1-dehydrogenase
MAESEEEFDFVVVGSGGGSMCASLVMRSRGASAVILEKLEFVGGTTGQVRRRHVDPQQPLHARGRRPGQPQAAIAYLEAAVDKRDAPGASPEKRRAFSDQAPQMLEFLISQGIKLRRVKLWPDYYDTSPGGSVPGRTVIAELFDANELGPWRKRLRTGQIAVAARINEALELPTCKQSFRGKVLAARFALRTTLAKITGRHWVTAVNALQGRMLQASLMAGVGTFGGVVTDQHARVLREDGSAIPGLYATGVTTASVMGRTYPGAGSSNGPNFTWGFVAANHAATALNRPA